jgi:hypothetical protein
LDVWVLLLTASSWGLGGGEGRGRGVGVVVGCGYAWEARAYGGAVAGGREEGVVVAVVALFLVGAQRVAPAEVALFVLVRFVDGLDAVGGAIERREVVG